MPIYKVTQKKLEEVLGQSYIDYDHTFKSKRFHFFLIMAGIAFLLAIMELCFSYFYFQKFSIYLLLCIILFFLISPLSYFALKDSYLQKFTSSMKKLLQDPELLWLNLKYEGDPGKKIIFQRHSYPYGEEFFQALAYLRKQGTDYGLTGANWTDHDSVRKYLKKLEEKGFVIIDGGDYKYKEWQFRFIDDNGQFINSLQKREQLLNNAWERMLDEVAKGWE